jgi:hypothetical protein
MKKSGPHKGEVQTCVAPTAVKKHPWVQVKKELDNQMRAKGSSMGHLVIRLQVRKINAPRVVRVM